MAVGRRFDHRWSFPAPPTEERRRRTLSIIVLLAGLVALIQGARLLVEGSSTLALKAGVRPLVVGLTVVSFGTSMPEFLVTLVSGLEGNADLAVANVVGSNIANVLLVLGLAAVIRPLPVGNATVVSEVPFSLTAAVLVGFLANASLFSTYPELSISRVDGLILLFFFLLFLLYVYKVSLERVHGTPAAETRWSRGRSVGFIVVAIVLLYLGGGWVVDGAVGIAQAWGVDDALIGLTIVAVGTSSPEIVASAVAAHRGEVDLAVGNVVGSNIFNLLGVLGATSAIVELPFQVINNADLLTVIGASSLVILALASSRRQEIHRGHGIVFLGLYVAYVLFAVQRG